MSDEPKALYSARRLLNRTGAAVALGIVTLFGLVITLLCWVEIPKDNQNVLLVMLGNLAAMCMAIVQWFFGGSMQSGRAKDPSVPGTATATATVTSEPAP